MVPGTHIDVAQVFISRPDREHRCGTDVRRRTSVPHRCSGNSGVEGIGATSMFGERRGGACGWGVEGGGQGGRAGGGGGAGGDSRAGGAWRERLTFGPGGSG